MSTSDTDYSKITKVKDLVDLLKQKDIELKARDEKLKLLTERIDALEGSQSVLKRIERLERDGYRSQQYSRRETVELVGLPEDLDGGKLEAKVVEVFEHAGVPVSPQSFHAIHYLRKKSTVIAKCVNRRDAIAILRAKRKLREVDADAKKKLGVNGKVFVNESLCPEFRRLFGICSSLYKAKKIASSFTINGKIKICQKEGDNHQIIEHMNDLFDIFGEQEITSIINEHKKKNTE